MAQPNIKSRAQMSQMKQWRATIETDYWSSVEWAIDLVFTLVGESLEGIQPPHILGLTSHVGLHIFVFSSFSIITIYFANMWCQDICIVQALKQRTAQIDAVLVRCSTHSQIQLNHKIPDSRTYASCKKSPWPGRFFNIFFTASIYICRRDIHTLSLNWGYNK